MSMFDDRDINWYASPPRQRSIDEKYKNMTTTNEIPAELVERMVAHFRKAQELSVKMRMAKPPAGSLSEDALAIAAALPKLVDPEKEAVRKLAREGGWHCGPDDDPNWESIRLAPGLALACFRAGREYERENGVR